MGENDWVAQLPAPQRQTRMEREFGAAQAARSRAFREATQRRGMPVVYGTGDPAKSGIDPKKVS